ncbi:DUF3177 family protein [Synechococcus sp. RSCCF101]|uniref:DUF3177 family protein n=1 Tax=Synechococcus sp. RSCCF101 TaxID=2511069 RepID=UPI001247389F|nr:DUF3177 family protein [Synechococcus sp. RSCCF101]QEY32251.1 DUF3177 family protein [Synechococcus sp. RSCCF101]
MTEQLYRTLVWLDYRLAVVFGAGLPLVLLLWAALRREGALTRLMGIYWKVASLMAISVLLLTDARPLGYLTSLLAQLAVLVTLWFWADLNEELADMPPWRSLPLTLRIWRWALTVTVLFGIVLGVTALPCMAQASAAASCAVWQEAPLRLHAVMARLFGFLFGARWTPPVAAFVGYLALVAYAIGFLQWLIVRLPRHGRVAGEF